MITGFGGACMAAYFLTALHNWTGGRPVTGHTLALLVALWAGARVALAFDETAPLACGIAPGIAFYGLFAIIYARAVWQGRRWGWLFLPGVIAALGVFDALFVAAARGAVSLPDSIVMTRVLVLFFAIKVSIVAGGMTPRFTGNWIRLSGMGRLPVSRPLATRVGLGPMLLAMGLTFGGAWRAASLALILAGGVQLWRMWGWRSLTARRYAPALMLHLAFAWVPLGLVLTGLAGLFRLPWQETDAIHALMMGAMAGLAMSIALRARAAPGRCCACRPFRWQATG
ncbi:hypothetical protein CCR78_10610 [Rhodovulum imhoffii]|nr:hypothetical protein [Rhodovulum imhoffii]